MTAAEERELTLEERGRERQTSRLRNHVYMALLGVATAATIPFVALVDSGEVIWICLATILAFTVVAHFIAGYLMAPVYSLIRRLEVRNYGPGADQARSALDDLKVFDLREGTLEVFAAMASVASPRKIDITMGLPAELASIERLARAGRVSELALGSLRRDMFRKMSHNLKSPLTYVMAHVMHSRTALDAGDAAGVKSALASIDELCLSMAELVERLLSVGWVQGEQEQSVAGKKTNISREIMSVVSQRAVAARGKNMTILPRVTAGLWVKGDRQMLMEMVASVVDNAVRYGPSDSTITVEAVDLPSTRSVAVVITDEGPGIPVQQREHVFEAFYGSLGTDENGNMKYGERGASIKVAGGGTSHGLGLSIVSLIARLHGASIELGDGPNGRGLAVRIVLVATDPPAHANDNDGVSFH